MLSPDNNSCQTTLLPATHAKAANSAAGSLTNKPGRLHGKIVRRANRQQPAEQRVDAVERPLRPHLAAVHGRAVLAGRESGAIFRIYGVKNRGGSDPRTGQVLVANLDRSSRRVTFLFRSSDGGKTPVH